MYLRSFLIACPLLGFSPLHAAKPPDNSAPRPEIRVDRAGIIAQRATLDLRAAARMKAGFPPATQASVEKTLRFLATQQSKDGSWGAQEKTTSTSLALLAYLGNGESPLSAEFGEGITNAMLFLIDRAAAGKGRLRTPIAGQFSTQWPREHALGTQALAESYLVCSKLGINVPGLKSAAQNCAQLIVDGTHKQGGWAPNHAEAGPMGGDLDMTVPSLHALWLTHHANIETRNAETEVKRALALLERLQTPSGAVQFSKLSHRPGYPMTGGCAFAFRIANRSSHAVPRRAISFLESASYLPFKYEGDHPHSNLSSFLYDALAVLHFEERNREIWYQDGIPDLLKHQEADGSFARQSAKPKIHPQDDAIQRSALACLILETPWRYDLSK